ncbi:unnamed protein product [Calypogeia fissa]
MPSMEERAKIVKVLSKLKEVIIAYYQETFPEHFPVKCSWDQVLEKVVIDDGELDRCRGVAGNKYLASQMARNIARQEEVPQGLASRLNQLFYDAFGGSKRLEPFISFCSENLMTTYDPSVLDEAAPFVPLAIVDFGKKIQQQWTVSQLEVFLKYIVETPKNDIIVIAIFIFHGRLLNNVLSALYNLTGVHLHLEFGSYERPEDYTHPGRFLKNERVQILLAGISHTPKPSWSDIFVEGDVNYQFFATEDRDFVQRRWKTTAKCIPIDESETDKEFRLKKEEYQTLRFRAPRYAFLDQLGGLVNVDAKPARVLIDIIQRFSSRGDTIFDFFSRGSVLKSAFEIGRECFVFSDSRKEFEFLKLYPNILRAIPTIDKFWDTVARINQGDPLDESDNDVTIVSPNGEDDCGDEDLSRFELGSPVIGIPRDEGHQSSLLIEIFLQTSSLKISS